MNHDNVASPKHYNSGKIEVIETIEDQKLGFHLGNSVKYILRAGKKDPAKTIEDLEKARWYLAREIELIKAAAEGREPCRPNDMGKKDEPAMQYLKDSKDDYLFFGQVDSLGYCEWGKDKQAFEEVLDRHKGRHIRMKLKILDGEIL